MTAVAAETRGVTEEHLELTGALPDDLKRELGGKAEPAERRRAPAGIPAEQAALAPEPVAAGAEPAEAPVETAGAAAEQLAAAVTAALRPDAAPLDYAPCRQGVGAAVKRLQGALLGLIRELEPRTGTTVPDSAIARARHLAADIRFVRPNELD